MPLEFNIFKLSPLLLKMLQPWVDWTEQSVATETKSGVDPGHGKAVEEVEVLGLGLVLALIVPKPKADQVLKMATRPILGLERGFFWMI